MKLGLMSAAFSNMPLGQLAEWAAGNGFEMLEVACWPPSKAERRYAGVAHIDVTELTPQRARDILDLMEQHSLQISSLAYYPNPLHPDPEHRRMVAEHLKRVIAAAEMLNVPVVGTFVGRDRNRTVEDNFGEFEKVWPPLVKLANDHGIKIAIENCPMIFSYDEWPAGNNIAWSPYVWRRIIETWGDSIGLNYDPSHLVWLMIDQERFIREFGPHIWHVQAKDVEIDRNGLYERGSLSGGIGWQIPRLPGLGEANWGRIFAALWRAGYDGDIIIEHEDRDFEKTDELIKRGFLLARDVPRPYIK